ncbi:MAG TPA: hypothetical protein VN363_08815 [Anaerolineales bacterium]|nr:hypothetical protein [Anaerolineales bacterium]
MARTQRRSGSFLIGLYAWVAAVLFGMVVGDIVYARLAPGSAAAFSAISDLLL